MPRVGSSIAREWRPSSPARRWTRRGLAAAALVTVGAAWKTGVAQEATPGATATATATATRLVTDVTGREVEVPASPTRVVALDPNRTIVNLVELGIVPVGATTNPTNPDAGFAPVLADVADRIENLGLTGSADLEQIVNLQPDLIFFATDYQNLSVDVLQAIAPTVAYPFPASSVDGHLRFVGEAVGRTEEAERVAAEFAVTIAAQREALGLTDRRIAAITLYNFDSTDGFGVLGPESVMGSLLVDLGAVLVPDVIAGAPVIDYSEDLSLEVIGEVLADADLIVAARYGGEGSDANFDAMMASPLWQLVPAVADGNLVVLDIQPAYGNWGVRGLELALADLADQLQSNG